MPGSDSVVRRSQLTPEASRIVWRLAARWTGGACVIVPLGATPARVGADGSSARRSLNSSSSSETSSSAAIA